MKYKIPNKNSKREIRKQGKNVLPLELMKYEKSNRDGTIDGRSGIDTIRSKDSELSEDGIN